jgi:hypothetical protein
VTQSVNALLLLKYGHQPAGPGDEVRPRSALARNERHPVTEAPTPKVIHGFGRADEVDRDARARLVSSICRFLTFDRATAAAAGAGGLSSMGYSPCGPVPAGLSPVLLGVIRRAYVSALNSRRKDNPRSAVTCPSAARRSGASSCSQRFRYTTSCSW